jgi:transposase
LLTEENGLPVDFRITAGQAAEYTQAVDLLEGRQAEAVIADRGYDSTEIVANKVQQLGATAVIPPRRHWKQPRSYDCILYKQRNHIEGCFNRPRMRLAQTSAICRYALGFQWFAL